MRKNSRVMIAILICATVFLSGCQSGHQDEMTSLVTAEDLKNCNLFINNYTCSSINEVRTVDDAEYREKVASLCTKVIQFRPLISADVRLGGNAPDTRAIFQNSKVKYIISFGTEAEKQLSLDYIHRDEPVLAVEKQEFREDGKYPQLCWSWYCTMSPADYATLFDLLQTYANGEILK